MTCRHCGVRIGILERWRYGDFCSREHKEEFALENERLTEEILRDLRRPLSPPEPVSIARAAPVASSPVSAAREEPREEPEPGMAAPLAQQEPSPIKAAPVAPAEEPPKTKPGWKEFASLASLDRPMTGAKPAAAPHRQVWIEERPPGEAQPYHRVLKRPLGLPHTQYRRRRPGLRFIELLLPIEPVAGGPSDPVAEAPTLWNGWDAETAAAAGPGSPPPSVAPYMGDVLAAYPLTAPWDRWERWPVAEPAPLATQAQNARPLPGPGVFSPAPSFAAPPPGGPPPPAPGAPGQMAQPPRSAPAGLPAAGPGGMLMPQTAAPNMGALGGSLPSSPVRATEGGSAPGAALPHRGGAAGPGGGAPGGTVAYHAGPVLSTPFAGVWREMAPPLFLAQADPAADLDPLDRPRRARPLPSRFVHGRSRIFRPRPHLPPPQTRVPAPPHPSAFSLRLSDAWTPSPAEPARWRP